MKRCLDFVYFLSNQRPETEMGFDIKKNKINWNSMRPLSLMPLERLLNHTMSKIGGLTWHMLNYRVRDFTVDVWHEEIRNFPGNTKEFIFYRLPTKAKINYCPRRVLAQRPKPEEAS